MTIQETLNSCLSQDFNDFEVLIGDDCSTDSTWQIICSNKNQKIRAYRHEINIGEYDNRNFLLENAKGEFVIFIDGEDIIYPYALSYILFFLNKFPNAKIIVAKSWDENISFPYFMDNKSYVKNQFIGFGFSALNFTQLIFNRESILSIGTFDRKEIKFGDSYIQLRMGMVYGVLFIPEGFSWWRRTKGQASEKILKDQFQFFGELNKYIPEMIRTTIFLSPEQKKQALINYYGNILRFCMKKLFFLNMIKSITYLIKYKIPFAYYSSLIKKPKRDFYPNSNIF